MVGFQGLERLLLAPIAAVVAAFFSREPLLAHWTQTFMQSASGFLAQSADFRFLGTKRTYRAALTMSVDRGGSEVAG
jgi:hypothetical protein